MAHFSQISCHASERTSAMKVFHKNQLPFGGSLKLWVPSFCVTHITNWRRSWAKTFNKYAEIAVRTSFILCTKIISY